MPRTGLSYANVMSTVAVMLAMSGTAVAATQISGSTIKDRTVSHKKMVLNTLTGAEIKESTLAKVPNADKLDGLDSTGFVKGTNVKVYQAKRTGLANSGATNVTLLTLPGLGRLDVVCNGDQLSWLFANTNAATKEYGTALSGDDGTQTSTVYTSGLLMTTAGANFFTYTHNNTGILPGAFHDEINVVTIDAAQATAHIRLSGLTGVAVNSANTCQVSAEATVY